MPKQQKRVTIAQYVEITDWLRANKERLLRLRYSQLDTATLASGELGYSVPRSTVKKCGEIAGIRWPGSPTKPPPVPIEREAIIILIGALAGLYVEEGKTVPDDLANLHSTYVKGTK